MDDWQEHLEGKRLKIIVKPKASSTKIMGWNEGRKALKVEVEGKPEGNEANMNLIKFFSTLSGKFVTLVSGKTSRTKVLHFE